MNQKIGLFSSAINLASVLSFALSMAFGSNAASYFSSMLIALSFVPMTCAYAHFSSEKTKSAGLTAMGFSAVYAAIILLVYFAQLTTVRVNQLNEQAKSLLDFQQFGLFFNYDLLGYSLMSLSTFFTGLTVEVKSRADRWLKGLLLIHGIFFFSCLIMPLLGVFTPDGEAWIGVVVLEFWCAYFAPISILSCRYFLKHEN